MSDRNENSTNRATATDDLIQSVPAFMFLLALIIVIATLGLTVVDTFSRYNFYEWGTYSSGVAVVLAGIGGIGGIGSMLLGSHLPTGRQMLSVVAASIVGMMVVFKLSLSGPAWVFIAGLFGVLSGLIGLAMLILLRRE